MKRKFLEDLGLEKEVIDKILDEAGGELAKVKYDYEELKKEKEHFDEEIKKRDLQLNDLTKNAKSVEDLTSQIAKLKEDNENARLSHESEMKSLKINNAVESALVGAKAKNILAVKALLKDLDKAELMDDGSVKGLAEQIKELQKADDSKFLFEEPQKVKITGAIPAPSSNNEITGQKDISKMTYSEMMAYKAANPEAKF